MKKRWILAAVIVSLAGGAIATGAYYANRRPITTASDEAYTAYSEGVREENKLYHRDAAAHFKRAVEIDPSFAMAWARLARLTPKSADKGAEAKRLIAKAVALRAGITAREQRMLDIVAAEINGEDRDKLERLCIDYVNRYPADCEGYEKLGRFYWDDEGKLDKSRSNFERVVKIDPNRAIAYNNLGYLNLWEGKYDEAEENFKKYAFLAPDQANPWDSLAELYLTMGRTSDAVAYAQRALAVRPDFDHAHLLIGLARELEGDFAAAERSYRGGSAAATKTMVSEFTGPQLRLLYRQGKLAEADAMAAELATQDSRRLDALWIRLCWGPPVSGEMLQRASEELKAQAEAIAAKRGEKVDDLKKHSGYRGPRAFLMGMSAADRGDWAEAEKLFSEAEESYESVSRRNVGALPAYVHVQAFHARALAATGQRTKAAELIARTLSISPGDPEARRLAAEFAIASASKRPGA